MTFDEGISIKKAETFSNFSLHHIFESENFRFPFFPRK